VETGREGTASLLSVQIIANEGKYLACQSQHKITFSINCGDKFCLQEGREWDLDGNVFFFFFLVGLFLCYIYGNKKSIQSKHFCTLCLLY